MRIKLATQLADQVRRMLWVARDDQCIYIGICGHCGTVKCQKMKRGYCSTLAREASSLVQLANCGMRCRNGPWLSISLRYSSPFLDTCEGRVHGILYE